MHQLRKDEIDERIHDFMAKKTSRKNLSQTITDWLLESQASKRPSKTNGYEILPLASKTANSQ